MRTIQFSVFIGGVQVGQQVFTGASMKIGRMAGSGVHIDDPSVSKIHAVVERDGDILRIIDLGSEAGIVVNGNRVESATIGLGDTIQVGSAVVKLEEVAAEPMRPAIPLSLTTGASAVAHGAIGNALPAMMESGMPSHYVDLNQFEDASREVVEVVAMWNNTVLQVNHFRDEKKTEFHVGEDFSCDFPIPAEVLHGRNAVSLVRGHEGGGATVTIMEGTTGDVTFEDGTRASLQELVGSHLQAIPGTPGDYAMALPAHGRIKMDFGSWTFLVNAVPRPKKFVAPLTFDWASQVYTGISGSLHALALFLLYFIPPNPSGLALDRMDENSRFIQIMMNAAEVRTEEVPDFEPKPEEEVAGGTGQRHEGTEGKMGKRAAKDANAHYGIKKMHDGALAMAKDRAKEMASEAGILGLMRPDVVVSPWGSDNPNGIEPEDALGHLMGDYLGTASGYEGIGLTGTGRGGGGTGHGTIGVGTLGTIGHGGGTGKGQGYGPGNGGLKGRRAKVPTVRSTGATVQGSLSKDVIRRIVHRHLNEVKHCYERELASRPDLEGRVAIRFIISATGKVQAAVVSNSTLGNPRTERCISDSVRRWTFPQPKGGGVVIVTYPFQLTSPQ